MSCCFYFLYDCCCQKRHEKDDTRISEGDEEGASSSVHTTQPLSQSRLSFSQRLSVGLLDKNVVTWGLNSKGELGLGSLSGSKVSTPTQLKFPHNVISISCGDTHTLFVLEDGSVCSCGSNDSGQLGHGQDNKTLNFVDGLEGRIISAKVGSAHSLAINSVGRLYSWGSNTYGQLGLDLKNVKKLCKRPQIVNSLLDKTVVQIAAGQFHSIVLTNLGEIYTCGSNSDGQLGIYSDENQRTFCLVKSLIGFPTTLIVAGGFHSLALSMSGAVYGWGRNNCGQLGVGDTEDTWQPTALKSVRSLVIKYIAAGLEHSAFLTKDGGLFTCGSGTYGQLGHETYSGSILPKKVLDFGSAVSQIACGNNHTLCLNENRLYHFGFDSCSLFGSSDGKHNSPKLINITEDIYSIFAGGQQSSLVIHANNLRNNTSLISCDYRVRNSQGQILAITEDCVSKAISMSKPQGSELLKFKSLFSSLTCWNASFLVNKEDHCSAKNIGVDLELAETVLSKLHTTKSQEIKDLMEEAICNKLLSDLPEKVDHKEMLRAYILLPLASIFNSGDNEIWLSQYSEMIQKLPPRMQDVVIQWLYHSPKDQILRLISLYKKNIVSILGSTFQTEMQKDLICKAYLTVLSLLYTLNKRHMRFSHHIFIIPQLSSKMNVAVDYLKWIEKYSFSFCNFPFVFDEQAKTVLLQTDQAVQMKLAMNKATEGKSFVENILMGDQNFLRLNVDRNNLVRDVITQLQFLDKAEMKKPIRIKFIGEEAEDAGGVRKEFFLLVLSEILDAKFGMFTYYNDSRLMWFNGNSFEDTTMYSLIGMLCGLAIYNFTIINMPFPLALYKKILGEKVDLSDLKELNPTVGSSLEQIMEYTGPDLESEFSLFFEVTQESYGEAKVSPLKTGGSDIAVTNENKTEFVDLYVNHVFNKSAEKQFSAFQEGFQRVCGSGILQLFHPTELQAMVTGNEDYVWGELEENCIYAGEYSVHHEVIKRFWSVFHSLTEEEKKQFLLFLTGSDRIPIAGMKELKMCIQPLENENFLPVAHTCFDLLDLPRYSSEKLMKAKLIQAIQQHQGFSLV